MKKRCICCGLRWGVSILQEIPRTGYICPWCGSKRKRARRDGRPYRAHKKTIINAL